MRHALGPAFLLTLSLTVGCAAPPGVGLAATKVRGPVAAVSGPPPAEMKVGKAESYMALGLFSHGDASISAAMEAGGISRIHHVDYEYKVLLGLFSVYTTLVYGE